MRRYLLALGAVLGLSQILTATATAAPATLSYRGSPA